MPYELINAPSVVQAFINDAFHGMLDKQVMVYKDDCGSGDMTEHQLWAARRQVELVGNT